MDNTPIFDIKPYLPYADSHPDAVGGFAAHSPAKPLKVNFPPDLAEKIPQEHRRALTGILSQDPRPAYQNEPERVYKLPFAGFDIHFTVCCDTLTVCKIVKL